jgi:hypothetical protein
VKIDYLGENLKCETTPHHFVLINVLSFLTEKKRIKERTDKATVRFFHRTWHLRASLFCNVTRRRLSLTDISGQMGPIVCPETSVNNYQSTACNIPEEQRSLFTAGRKSEITHTWHCLTRWGRQNRKFIVFMRHRNHVLATAYETLRCHIFRLCSSSNITNRPQCLANWICFALQMKRWGGTYQSDPYKRADLNHSTLRNRPQLSTFLDWQKQLWPWQRA